MKSLAVQPLRAGQTANKLFFRLDLSFQLFSTANLNNRRTINLDRRFDEVLFIGFIDSRPTASSGQTANKLFFRLDLSFQLFSTANLNNRRTINFDCRFYKVYGSSVV